MPPWACVMSSLLLALPLGCSKALPRAADTTGALGLTASPRALDEAPCEDGRAWQDALRALPPTAVRRVEATYLRDTCAGTALVSGTKLSIVPDAGQSSAWARLIECHAARVRFLGPEPSPPRSPTAWMPDGWVDIKVEGDTRNIVLTLHAESATKNIRLFRHTAAFADAREE